MKKISLLATAFCFLLLSCVHHKNASVKNLPLDNSLLWQISGKDLTAPSYLYGTMHAVCGEDFTFSNKLKTALNYSKAIYFEVDINQLQNPAAFAKLMTANQPLTSGLTATEIKELDSLLLLNNIKLESVKNFKPSIVLSLLTNVQIRKCHNGFKMWETELNNYFPAEKKRGAFETIEQQMEILDSVYDVKTLIASLKSSNTDTFIAMSKIYGAEKLGALDSIMNKESDEYSKSKMDIFLYNRNKNWVTQIPQVIQNQPTFIAVGAGHLAGKKGVINLLREQGYTVTAVKN